MTVDHWLLIAALAASTIGLRVLGYLAGAALMERLAFRRLTEVFPGCLIVALVASALAEGGPPEFLAAAAALLTAIATRNIIATMLVGMATVTLTTGLF
ncbi:MAG: AzlD domain-containing protein [Pseudomonadota bacterium]